MKISATYNQQLTEGIHMVMVRKFLILRFSKIYFRQAPSTVQASR
jgi:hypothetical protein